MKIAVLSQSSGLSSYAIDDFLYEALEEIKL